MSQNVNCAITVMADTDRSSAWAKFGQSFNSGKIAPAKPLSIAVIQVFCWNPAQAKKRYIRWGRIRYDVICPTGPV